MKLSSAKSLFSVVAIAMMDAFDAILEKNALRIPVGQLEDRFPRKKHFVNINAGLCRAIDYYNRLKAEGRLV